VGRFKISFPALAGLVGRFKRSFPALAGLGQKIIFHSGHFPSPNTVDTVLYTDCIAGQYACLFDISSKAGSGRTNNMLIFNRFLLICCLSLQNLVIIGSFIFFKAVSSIYLVFRFCLVGPLNLLFWQIFLLSSVRPFATSYVNNIFRSYLFHIHHHSPPIIEGLIWLSRSLFRYVIGLITIQEML
jgi:hypothetical protein